MTPETDARRLELVAGIGVFRICESVILGYATKSDAVALAREHIDRIANPVVQNRLLDLLKAAAQKPDRHSRSVIGGRLMAYGVDLHTAGVFAPAADVFALIYEVLPVEVDLRLQAMAHRAYSLRQLSRLDDAEAVYASLVHEAKRLRRRPVQLDAELGLAKVVIDRGNIPLAEKLVHRVVARASRSHALLVLAKARREMARIAGIRNDPVGVVQFTAMALEWLDRGEPIDRAMVDVGLAFRELRRLDIARVAATYVVRQTKDWNQGVAATLLLYHLAIDEGDNLLARRHRYRLESERLSPVFAAELHEANARDASARGSSIEAVAQVRQMLEVAERHRLNEIIARAERGLRDLDEGRVLSLFQFQPERLSNRSTRSVEVAEQTVSTFCADRFERTGQRLSVHT